MSQKLKEKPSQSPSKKPLVQKPSKIVPSLLIIIIFWWIGKMLRWIILNYVCQKSSRSCQINPARSLHRSQVTSRWNSLARSCQNSWVEAVEIVQQEAVAKESSKKSFTISDRRAPISKNAKGETIRFTSDDYYSKISSLAERPYVSPWSFLLFFLHGGLSKVAFIHLLLHDNYILWPKRRHF